MSKSNKYAIHTDFLHFPCFNFSFNRLIVTLLNGLLRMERFVRQHRLLRTASRHRITGSGGHTIKVLQFYPPPVDGKTRPALVYFHGGAFILTYASTHLQAIASYARETGCTVFLVDYRKAHHAPFPAGFNDCCTALDWVADNAATLGVDATRIAVMGDSAGGALAAGVSQWAQDRQRPPLCAQLLIYPVLDDRCNTPSATEFDDVPLWNGVSNRGMWQCYLRAVAGDQTPAYAAPTLRENLEGLPPTYVETAEFDPLRDEGIAYARRLQRAQVRATLNQTRSTIHGFDSVVHSSITQDALRQRIQFLHSAFSSTEWSEHPHAMESQLPPNTAPLTE